MSYLTTEFISQKLASVSQNRPNSDGYSEIPFDDKKELRCAAVLVPLTFYQGEWHVLYTRRTEKIESHKGQVSFPGGACDDGEITPEQTALREADEEIGMKPADVDVLGRLGDMITISSFRVTPVVGVFQWPYVFRAGGVEVARVFTIPLLWLADKKNYWEFSIGQPDRKVIAYHPYDGELLWGATARMTVNFLETLGLLS